MIFDYQTQLGIIQSLTSSGDFETKLERCIESLTAKLSPNLAILALFDLTRRKTTKVILRGAWLEKFSPAEFEIFQEWLGERMLAEAIGELPSDDSWVKRLNAHQGSLAFQVNLEQLFTSPVFYQGQLYGLLAFAFNAEHKMAREVIKPTLSLTAQQIALAIEIERLKQNETVNLRSINALRELTRLLNYRLDQTQVLELIIDKLLEVVDYDSASIMLVFGDYLKIVAYRKFRSAEQLELPNQIEALPHIKKVLQERKPVIIHDTMNDPRWHQLAHSNYIRCWMGVPLIAGKDTVIGLINLDKEETGYYTTADAELATTFANQAAIAIENSRLYAMERERVEQLDALRATIADISSELELSKLLNAILHRAIVLLDASGGELGIYAPERQVIEIVAAHNMGRDYVGTQLQVGEGAMGLAVQTLEAVIVEDYARWEHASPQYQVGPHYSVLAVPIMIGGRVLGAIAVTDQRPERTFDTGMKNLLTLFAQHAAIAVENARLYKSTRGAVDRLSILHQVSQKIVTAGLELEEIYTAIHQATAQLMPAEAFAISLQNPEDMTIEAVYLYDRSGRAPSQKIPTGHGLSGMVISKGESIYIPDLIASAPPGLVHFGDPQEVRSVLAVPLRLRGEVIGMLSTQCYQPNAYSQEDMHLLEMLSAYAAIAIDNTRLLMEIQNLAITDSLTQVFNRGHLFTLGEREFLRSRRFNRPLSLIMLDIDHFKLVNDTYGHAVGDRVLFNLAQFLKKQIRETDIVARYGGEEFVLLLPETKIKDGYLIAQRIQENLPQIYQPLEKGTVTITVSMGVAEMTAQTRDFSALIEKADQALYAAKRSGRDRIESLETGEAEQA